VGGIVLDNLMFDQWLTKKAESILMKVDREQITTEEMIILTLKAQTNHFFSIEEKFDKKFDRIYSILMWGFGLIFTSIFGLYIKMFLN
jgi:hypothetical protein